MSFSCSIRGLSRALVRVCVVRTHTHICAPTCLPIVPHLAGIYTSYRPFLKSDGTLVKLLSSSESLPGRRPIEAQNVIIRKHALELTTSFVIPLVVC